MLLYYKCAAHLIKYVHLTNLHICVAFRRGKDSVTVWVEVRIRVRVGDSVGVRVTVRALIKCTFASHAAHLVKCAD